MIDIKFINKTNLTDKDKTLENMLGKVNIKDYKFVDTGVYIVIDNDSSSNITKNTNGNQATEKQIKYAMSLIKKANYPKLNYTDTQLKNMTKVEIGKVIKSLQKVATNEKSRKAIIKEPATEPQKDFIKNLIYEGLADKDIDVESLNKKEAGDIIKAISRGKS